MVLKNKDENDHWKVKYMVSLDEIETKEKQWSNIESLLHKALAKLALAGYGHDKSLDKKLDSLREAVRRESDSQRIIELANKASDASIHIRNPTPESVSSQSVKPLLLNIIEGIKLTGYAKKKLISIKTAVKNSAEKDDLSSQIREFLELLNQSLIKEKAPADTPSEKTAEQENRTGLLSKIFSSSKKDSITKTTDDSTNEILILHRLLSRCESSSDSKRLNELVKQSEATPDKKAVDTLMDDVASLISDALNHDSSSKRYTSTPTPVNKVLLELMDGLSFPPEYENRVTTITDSLETELKPNDVSLVLIGIINLIEDIQQSLEDERKEIEHFLKDVTNKIKDIDTSLDSSRKTDFNLRENNRTLNKNMHEQVEHMRTSVESASNLSELKQTITNELDMVKVHISKHQQSQEEIIEENEKQITVLHQQLNGMQNETQRLHENLLKTRELASKDMLTGVANRRTMESQLESEYIRWKRYGTALSILMLDIDFFKKINDNFGHQAGDKALRALAKKIMEAVRETDIVARYGGEEFTVIMPETSADAALKVAEKLRITVETCPFHYREKPVQMTISCGVAQFRQNDTKDSVLKRADDSLYKAKSSGRNQCILEEIT